VKGAVDKKTGMVMNLSDLKIAMKRVLDQLDHKNLSL
jgi:6-pyruvoyltetrahydropterin/6-carboxytetrahydropterin synthase